MSNIDHHDIQAWASPRSFNKRVLAFGLAGLCVVGIAIAAWTVASKAQPPTASTTTDTPSGIPLAIANPANATPDPIVHTFAVQATYAYLRLSRDDQDMQVERHKAALAQVGVDAAHDLGHHPGEGPLGLLPTSVQVSHSAQRDNQIWDIDTLTRLGTPTGLTWVALRIPVIHRDGHVGLAGRPRFIPSPPVIAYTAEEHCQRGASTLSDHLVEPVRIGVETWLASPNGLNGVFTLHEVSTICVNDHEPSDKTPTSLTGWAELVLVEPHSQDTFTQQHPFTATQTNGVWVVAFNTPQHDGP